MEKKDRIESIRFVRVLWHCTNPKCASDYWKMYGEITLESKRGSEAVALSAAPCREYQSGGSKMF